jgi:hypothetical protein
LALKISLTIANWQCPVRILFKKPPSSRAHKGGLGFLRARPVIELIVIPESLQITAQMNMSKNSRTLKT